MLSPITVSFVAGIVLLIIIPILIRMDQSLSAVANKILISSPTGGFVRFDAYAGSNLKQGLVVKMNSATRTADLAQANADPNSSDDPFGIVDEQMDVDIDTALTAADALRIISLKCRAVVWLLLSGAESTSTNGVARGQQCDLSVSDAGMVRLAPDFASLVESTPTTGGLADAIQQLKNSQLTRIGTFMETHAGHATEDRWVKVRLD